MHRRHRKGGNRRPKRGTEAGGVSGEHRQRVQEKETAKHVGVAAVKQIEKEEMLDPMEEAISIAKELMEKGKPASMAAKEAAKLTGQTKGDVYKRLMEEEEE